MGHPGTLVLNRKLSPRGNVREISGAPFVPTLIGGYWHGVSNGQECQPSCNAWDSATKWRIVLCPLWDFRISHGTFTKVLKNKTIRLEPTSVLCITIKCIWYNVVIRRIFDDVNGHGNPGTISLRFVWNLTVIYRLGNSRPQTWSPSGCTTRHRFAFVASGRCFKSWRKVVPKHFLIEMHVIFYYKWLSFYFSFWKYSWGIVFIFVNSVRRDATLSTHFFQSSKVRLQNICIQREFGVDELPAQPRLWPSPAPVLGLRGSIVNCLFTTWVF